MKSLHEILGEARKKTPHATALVHDDENNETDSNRELQRDFVAMHPVLKTHHPVADEKQFKSNRQPTEIQNNNRDPMKRLKVSENLEFPLFAEFLAEKWKQKKKSQYEEDGDDVVVNEDVSDSQIKKWRKEIANIMDPSNYGIAGDPKPPFKISEIKKMTQAVPLISHSKFRSVYEDMKRKGVNPHDEEILKKIFPNIKG